MEEQIVNNTVSFGELANYATQGSANQKKEITRKTFKFDNEYFVKFDSLNQTCLYTIGELGGDFANALADVFGRDVAGVIEEIITTTAGNKTCFKAVFRACDDAIRGGLKAVAKNGNESSNSEAEKIFSVYNRMTDIKRGNYGSMVDEHLTSEAVDFILQYLIDDNIAYNDKTNRKFEERYVSYEVSNVDGKNLIEVHGITLDKVCSLVFGPANYDVKIGNGTVPEYGRTIMITRMKHQDLQRASKKYVRQAIGSDGLRVPTFKN